MTNGLTEGELVISEGLQRVRPDEAVSAGPASPPPVISRAGGQGSAGGQGAADSGKPPSEAAKPTAGQPGTKQ